MRTRYSYRKSYLENFDLTAFDPSRSYTAAELEAFADLALREDCARRPEAPKVLFQEHAESRWSREVNTKAGTPDDEITASLSKDGQTMYNRTHPEGRKVNSDTQRKKNGASFYR